MMHEQATRILEQLLLLAPFEGLGARQLAQATRMAGLPENTQLRFFPNGVPDALLYWQQCTDSAMEQAFKDYHGAEMSTLDKVKYCILWRLEYLSPHREAARKALAFLSLPAQLPQAARMTWETADRIWQQCADKSTDYNWYTKRLILSGVLSSTLLYWLNDDSDDMADTKQFLTRRLDNVMAIERGKKKMKSWLGG